MTTLEYSVAAKSLIRVLKILINSQPQDINTQNKAPMHILLNSVNNIIIVMEVGDKLPFFEILFLWM